MSGLDVSAIPRLSNEEMARKIYEANPIGVLFEHQKRRRPINQEALGTLARAAVFGFRSILGQFNHRNEFSHLLR